MTAVHQVVPCVQFGPLPWPSRHPDPNSMMQHHVRISAVKKRRKNTNNLFEAYLFRDTASIMRGPCYFHSIVNVEPFRMMILFFGQCGRAAHEIPRLLEISKYICFLNGVAV